MSFLSEAVAVVTGAGSGIGRALASELARSGAALALADIDPKGLGETLGLLPVGKSLVTTHRVDVADEQAMRAFAGEVTGRHGRVTLLINNAGSSLHGNFDEISLEDFRALMEVNFWGTVYGVHYFLPTLREQSRSHIVNLSSVFGIVAPAGQTAYAASKFAVRGFTEALRHELAQTRIGVSSVHPGGIQTPIARNSRVGARVSVRQRDENIARFEKFARTSPAKAAARILRGVERAESRILIGADAYEIDFLQRLRPASYWKLLAPLFGAPRPGKP